MNRNCKCEGCESTNKAEIEWHLSGLYFYLSGDTDGDSYSKSMAIHSFNIVKKYVEDCLKKEKTEIPVCKRCNKKFSDYRELYSDYRGNGYFHLCPLDISDKYKLKEDKPND